jgi:membrane protease subunit HflK
MDEVLTLKRSEIASLIKEQTVATIKNYNTGIWVLDVVMQFAKAPDEVRAAFDEVIKASADEERLVNQARAYENEILPKAKGIAERLKNEALAYKQEAILIAEGKVQRFNLVLPQYQKAPKVMQTRMYLDAIEQILSKTSKIVVDQSIGNSMVYLPLDQLLAGKVDEEKDKATPSTEGVNPSGSSSSSEAKALAPLVMQNQKETNS